MLRDRLPPRPVAKYYAFMATSSAGLATPIWVLFLRSNDLSYAAIMALDALWWVGIVLGEIPTGYVGDRFGWRNSLVVGNVLRAGAVVAMGLSTSVIELGVVYLVWALGSTLQSGSSDAWLYEVLDERLDSDDFAHVRGRGESLTLAVAAVGSVAGAYAGSVDLRWPFFVTGGVWAVGVLVLLTFPTVAVDPDDRIGASETLPLLRERLLSPELRSFVLRVGLLLAVVQSVARLTQPVAVDLGVPVAGLGWLYAGFTLLAAVASARAEWVRSHVGVGPWLLVAPLVLSLALGGSWIAPLAALPTFVLLRAVRSTTRPLANQYLNDRLASAGRATVLSGASMAYSVVAIPFSLGVGALSDAYSPLVAMGATGVVLGTVTLVGYAVDGGTVAGDEAVPGEA